jgi:hypothetical protein
MSLSRILYLLVFFAPVAFLLGYMAGAPQPTAPSFATNHIDTRQLPVSSIDFYRHENSLVVRDEPWLQPNTAIPTR